MMNAFFNASEMAFTSVNRIKLKDMVEKGVKKAARLENFLSREGAFLSATLVGVNISVVIASALATRVFTEEVSPEAAPLLATVAITVLSLIFGEIIPKMITRETASGFAMNTVTTLEGFYRGFYPLIVSINSVCRLLLFPFSREDRSSDMELSKKDLKKIIYLGHETGEVEADEVELIHKVLDFESKKVEKIMVPLYRVSSINVDDSVDNLKRLVELTGFSRIPVYSGDKKSVIGIVNIYDVLFDKNGGNGGKKVGDYLRGPVSINRKDRLDIALARLKNKKQPMGIVVEANKDVVGILTIEDILEEIVGEI
jgi:CBS domain containing-hemolysin-like protein